MAWPVCTGIAEENEKIDETKQWHGLDFHQLGLILSAVFGAFSILMSWYLVWRHATHYLKPWEQKHIIRVLFMVPIYSFVSFLSYLFYTHAVYFEVIRDCYEAFAIASFFSLMCHYIAPDLHSQKDFFRNMTPRNWVWPISTLRKCCGGQHGIWRTPGSGLTWFNVIWLGIFQYCFVRVFLTFVSLITQAAGRYCLESLNPAFAHIWVMVIDAGCVTVAMYCLIQFYIQLKHDLAEHQPLLKVAAIKLVIFLSFWQQLLISFLTSSGAIKASAKFQTPDIKIGIPSLLLCVEMAVFSVFHLWAFPWKVYDIKRSQIVAAESAPGFLPDPKTAYQGGRFGVHALMDAFNPWDLIKAVGRAFKWAAVGRRRRHEDISYKDSTGLEPTRNQLTAFDNLGGKSFDGSPPVHIPILGKSTRYAPLTEEEDSDRLLSRVQSNPTTSEYPRPMERLPDRIPSNTPNAPSGDIGTVGIYQHPGSPNPSLQPKSSRNASAHSRQASFETQDTAYHGSQTSRHSSRLAPVPPPDSFPLGPPGRKSYENEQGEWGMWGGVRDTERDLGADHGVRDNHF